MPTNGSGGGSVPPPLGVGPPGAGRTKHQEGGVICERAGGVIAARVSLLVVREAWARAPGLGGGRAGVRAERLF